MRSLLYVLVLALVMRTEAHRLGVEAPPAAWPAARMAGARQVRIRAEWPRVQPTAQRWRFDWLDTQIATAQRQALQVVLVFGPTPPWAAHGVRRLTAVEAGRACPSAGALRAYVTRIAARYRGRIAAYQLWERPTPSTLLAYPAQAYALYRTAAAAVHAVQPSLRVIAAEPGDVSLGWLSGYLAVARGAERPDILLLAPVHSAPSSGEFRRRVQALRTRLLPPMDAPALWAEIPLTDTRPAECLAAMLAALQAGCDTLCLVAPRGNASHLADLLRQAARLPDALVSDPPAVPVVSDSVALDATGADPAAIRALPALPFGRFGLDTRYYPPLLVASRDEAPWVHFDLPDGFLFLNLERRPVTVTVRVYGVTQPLRTGFDFYYESPSGMRYSRWQYIEVGPETLYTYTIRLPDALCANQDGYDLRLNIGGSAEPVRLTGLIVRKD